MARRSFLSRVISMGRRGGRSFGSSYQAASWNRLNQDWVFAPTRSADAEIRYELRTMRNRARDLVRNSPFGVRYGQILAENVIGPTGITLQAKNVDPTGQLLKDQNKAIEAAWDDAGRASSWDVEQKLTREEQLNVGVFNWGSDGEILIRLYRGPRYGPYGFRAKLLDPDLLNEKWNQARIGTQPLIRQGVEYDDDGAPVAYHLWTRHPNDAGDALAGPLYMERVPASDIIHAFIPMRPGQSRGVPHGAAIMSTLKMLDGYIEAELVAARTASAKMGALVDLVQDPLGGSVRDQNAGTQDVPMEAEPGSMLDLRGQSADLKLWDPQHPTAAFPDFTKMLSHFLAIGYGVSYGTLTGDLNGATYSSMKVGQQPERDHFKRLTRFLINHVLDRLFREWLAQALLNRKIPGVTGFDPSRWARVRWQSRGFPSPDPIKDVTARLMKIAAGADTITAMAAEDGRDLEEVAAERAEEIKMFETMGVPSVIAISTAPKPAKGNDENAGGDGTPDSGDQSAGSINGDDQASGDEGAGRLLVGADGGLELRIPLSLSDRTALLAGAMARANGTHGNGNGHHGNGATPSRKEST